MTKIEMLYNKNIYVGFRLEGHAEYNPGGPDIVCASLSAMSQMTINGILDWTGLSAEDVLKELVPRGAILHFELPWNLTSIVTNQMFKSFELYVGQLIEQYPDYISLGRRQVDDYKDN